VLLAGRGALMRGLLHLAIGTAVFIAITFFEQLPVLGWLGGAISIAAWVWLTRALLSDHELDVIRSGLSVGWAALLGGFTGFVGAIASWAAQTGNLFGFTTHPGDRFGAAFGFVGSTIGIVYWPIVGALVCVGVAVSITGKRLGRLRREE
jgi:hypothetical protein